MKKTPRSTHGHGVFGMYSLFDEAVQTIRLYFFTITNPAAPNFNPNPFGHLLLLLV
ncbi:MULTISPECIES: hypothetical protein [Sporosarcina]|uniref:hypothetical protein n=1 Tax=Sporosarcina TaxID=1569 RepID=UPI0012F4C559|nr:MULTISPECIES: hypothetical protein [Sporosarcina]